MSLHWNTFSQAECGTRHNGAKKVLIPIENKRNFLDVSADILESVDAIFYGDMRTASLKTLAATQPNGRCRVSGRLGRDEHRPKSHQKHLQWTPGRMIEWARNIGPECAKVIEKILADRPHPEMGFRSCLGLFAWAKP